MQDCPNCQGQGLVHLPNQPPLPRRPARYVLCNCAQHKHELTPQWPKFADGLVCLSGHWLLCPGCDTNRNCDMYIIDHLLLCGDCRYKHRHGRHPRHEAHPGFNGHAMAQINHVPDYDGGFGSETLHRMVEFECPTAHSVGVLNSIIDGSKLSLE